MKLPSFKRVMRGYDPESVDQALEEMQQQLSDLNAANKELRLQVNSLREQTQEFETRLKSYVSIEKELRDALLNAQRIANQVQEDAQTNADKLLESARNEAENFINEARSEAEKTASELESLIASDQDELAQLEQQKEGLITLNKTLKQKLEHAMAHMDAAVSSLNHEEIIPDEQTQE